MKSIILCFALLAAATPVEGKDLEGEHAVFGAGGEKCETFLVARRSGGTASVIFTEWVFAYFSAFNVIIPDTYNIGGEYGSKEIHNWLVNYCSGSPSTLFVVAVANLTERLYPQRANISPYSNNKAKWGNFVKDAAAVRQ